MSERYVERDGKMFRATRVDLGPSGLDRQGPAAERRTPDLDTRISKSIHDKLIETRSQLRRGMAALTGSVIAAPVSVNIAMNSEGPMWARVAAPALNFLLTDYASRKFIRADQAFADVRELNDIRDGLDTGSTPEAHTAIRPD
jgi:hypothetical protein